MQSQLVSAAPLIVVNTQLPEGGLEAILNMDMTPINNARGAMEETQTPDRFPMNMLTMAASSPEFLQSLGKPLGIAKDLESEPGVWMLSTPDNRHQWVIFSDCHRKNAWKGGQICAVYGGNQLTMEHPTVDILRQAVAEQWGVPTDVTNLFAHREFFEAQEAAQPGRVWPREDAPPVIKTARTAKRLR